MKQICPGFVKSCREDPASVSSRPGVLALWEHVRVCVCVCVWRGGVIWFPWLIFSFSPLVSWNTPGRAPALVNRCEHQRRQQDETQEGAWSPNIWQGKASMTRTTPGWKKKEALRSAGIKVCPGCLSHRGLPQHIQMGFPEDSTSRPCNKNEAGKEATMWTWKSVCSKYELVKAFLSGHLNITSHTEIFLCPRLIQTVENFKMTWQKNTKKQSNGVWFAATNAQNDRKPDRFYNRVEVSEINLMGSQDHHKNLSYQTDFITWSLKSVYSSKPVCKRCYV